MKSKILAKISGAAVMIGMVSVMIAPTLANAQAGASFGGTLASCALGSLAGDIGGMLGGGSSGGSKKSVPVSENGQALKDAEFQKTKACSLDGLVWALAGEILQNMTTSVVNWINSGFNGNPSFIQDPGGYFLDQADQITGEFLSNSGPLGALCGNFGLDIRLSLAMNRSQNLKQRYTCTLKSVINNAKNAHVSATVDSNPNGATLGSIMNGSAAGNSNAVSVNGGSIDQASAEAQDMVTQEDGWQNIMDLSTNPQNNPVGAYILTRDDEDTAIATNQQQINNDLNRGNGFLSWKKCQDDGQGGQACSVETPGSVINGALEKQMGAGVDRLNAAHQLNEIVGALFQQLITSVLSKGLHATSGVQSGQNASLVNQLSAQSTQQADTANASAQQDMLTNVNSYLKPAADYTAAKDQVVSVLQTEFLNLNAAVSLCTNQYRESDAADLQAYITSTVNPVITLAQTDDTTARELLAAVRSTQAALQNSQSLSDTQAAGNQYSNLIMRGYLVSSSDVATAQAAVTTAQQTAATWHIQTASYTTKCSASSSSTGNTIAP